MTSVIWSIASGVGGVGGNGVRKHLTSSYLVAVDGVTLTCPERPSLAEVELPER